MEIMIGEEAFLDNYLGLLSGLSKESKIKLVESLNSDIKNNNAAENDWIDKLYGSFISDIPVETMISEIQTTRRFSRKIADF